MDTWPAETCLPGIWSHIVVSYFDMRRMCESVKQTIEFEMWVFPKIVGFPLKSSSLRRFSIINHPFWGTPIFGNTNIFDKSVQKGSLEGFFFVCELGSCFASRNS